MKLMSNNYQVRTTSDNQNELFIVVDRNDQIVGYRTRKECHSDKSLIHRAVGVLVYNSAGRLLLQKRSKTKDLQPGTWAISSSGHVTKGESYEEAAKRELKEELGIELSILLDRKHMLVDSQESEMDVLFKAFSEGPFFPDPVEVDRVEFFLQKELKDKIASGDVVLSTWADKTLKLVGFI